MPRKSRLSDYEPLKRPRSSAFAKSGAVELDAEDSLRLRPLKSAPGLLKQTDKDPRAAAIPNISKNSRETSLTDHGVDINPSEANRGSFSKLTFLRRGHALTYAAVFLFTIVLYARPAEFYPSPLTASIALIVGLLTLAIFFPSQLAVEGTLSARPREV